MEKYKKNKKFNFKVSYTMTLQTSINKLWSIISSESNLEFYHPFCKKNIAINWPGINSVDEIHYYNGDIYTRKFIKWTDNVGYDLYISKKNYPKSLVKWRIKESNEFSKLNITIYPYVFNTSYKLINIIPFYAFVKPRLYIYLKNIEKGLIYYLETNKKVEKNQFGNHNWLSN